MNAEQVAKIVAGIDKIGSAKRLLELEGCTAVIVGQRITINDTIEAHLCGVNGHTWWDCYASDGTPPVFTVGTRLGSWVGAE